MQCPRCQHDNSPTARFCEECGPRLTPTAGLWDMTFWLPQAEATLA
jgi:hypothetical protein